MVDLTNGSANFTLGNCSKAYGFVTRKESCIGICIRLMSWLIQTLIWDSANFRYHVKTRCLKTQLARAFQAVQDTGALRCSVVNTVLWTLIYSLALYFSSLWELAGSLSKRQPSDAASTGWSSMAIWMVFGRNTRIGSPKDSSRRNSNSYWTSCSALNLIYGLFSQTYAATTGFAMKLLPSTVSLGLISKRLMMNMAMVTLLQLMEGKNIPSKFHKRQT